MIRVVADCAALSGEAWANRIAKVPHFSYIHYKGSMTSVIAKLISPRGDRPECDKLRLI